ncbi:hypothetical protein ALQ33_00798 [Pseudomonas syringae pv. philadelphi]|uniref:Tat pathway signal sequence domain protein n=1 Tax=Pseudomonas syringae pv. philadelphi TaxID=251706 RepID=A0A3M3YEH1_9PSED|nr:Tat pathway signal sequence domain protein [Pseudomonas syringae group genomosp. 3]RMO80842.1 hypothetical protein ALQ33_00798 [Pseudomonas syringae pv. philadelphi]
MMNKAMLSLPDAVLSHINPPHPITAAPITFQTVTCKAVAIAACGLLTGLSTTILAHERTIECSAQSPGAPIFITADCIDPEFVQPVIDSQDDLTSPTPVHRVSGHFVGTDAKFSFYFPPKAKWQGRFFHKVYPLGDGVAPDEVIGFGVDSGAYTIETVSPSGYRANAAAAKFSKVVAKKFYALSDDKIYGYIYGGSGGSYLTISAIENSSGVWDGAVPFVIGVPTSIPNNFFIRAFARLVLEDKAQQISDAVRPGGSGKPFGGLNATEASILAEVTAMGVPLRGWDNYAYILGMDDPQGLLGFAQSVKDIDPGYADDFWSKPGYLGTEQSPLGDLVRDAKIDRTVTIRKIERDASGRPERLHLAGLPAIKNSAGLDFNLGQSSGDAASKLSGTLDVKKGVITLSPDTINDVLSALRDGAKVRINNRWAIALTSYHRHQVPASGDFAVWDQFRKADGSPLYPQRAKEIGRLISANVSGGGTHSGKVNGKIIVISNALDVDAYPWHADWYSQQMKKNLGDRYEANVRVWLNDNADHLDGSVVGSGSEDNQSVRLIDYNGILQQAVRDVSAWAENGDVPPASTRYELKNGQVALPADVSARKGIQPTVVLTSKSGAYTKAKVGEPITLLGNISVPKSAGKIVVTEWSATGSNDFVDAPLPHKPSESLAVHETFAYPKAGVYYPVLRVTSQREGNVDTEFARVRNLARVRVVVE